MSVVGDGDQYQKADFYPLEFLLAVQPDEVNPNLCYHESDDPVCFCVHDWRIHWGNVSKTRKSRATYI